MTETDKQIVDLLEKEYTTIEVANKLNISLKQLHQRLNLLKAHGLVLIPEINTNGKIRYLKNFVLTRPKTNTQNLKLIDNSFKALLISDLHIGNEKQNLNYLKQIYQLCLDKNIHLIINAGDFIDGPSSKGKKIIADTDKQIQYALKNHPFNEQILNLICFGNHDYDTLQKTGQDIAKALEYYRPDFISLGYGIGIINVGNDQIIVKHPTAGLPINKLSNKLILCGHKHKMAFNNKENNFLINIPPLSDLCFHENQKLPGAIIMELFFNRDGIIKEGNFECLTLNKKIITVSENSFEFNFPKEKITEEEILLPPKRKVLTPSDMSQIEKFNNRYRQ